LSSLDVTSVAYLATCGALWFGCSRAPTDQSRSVASAAAANSVATIVRAPIDPISSPVATISAPPTPLAVASVGVGKETHCGEFCSHTASLHCGTRETCEAACGSMLGARACQDRVQAFLVCVEKEPIAHWECVNGLPAIRDGYCDAEQAQILECIKSLGRRTPSP
jgi:hypothetical protein